MPTYHYRCATCEQHLEVVHSMTAEPITECAACGGQMQKVLRPVGIVLKGSGFYRTDSRSSASKAKTDTKSESKESKSESKETKSESKETKSSGESPPSTSPDAKSA